MLEAWIVQVNTFVTEKCTSEIIVEHQNGPQGIIDAWRSKLQSLTTAFEQMKRRDVRTVVSLLSSMMKSNQEKNTTSLAQALKSWKNFDIVVTEAINEVCTIHKFIC